MTPDGALECSSFVGSTWRQGRRIHLLKAKPTDLYGAIVGALSKAIRTAKFRVTGAMIEISARAAVHIEEFNELASSLRAVVPHFFVVFSLGQQGMIENRACHCNLVINLSPFG